jgi:hypothetical protein
MEIIFPFEGALIRKVDDKYVDLRTGEIYEIKKLKDRVALLNTKVVGETSPSAIVKKNMQEERRIMQEERRNRQEEIKDTQEEKRIMQEERRIMQEERRNRQEEIRKIAEAKNIPKEIKKMTEAKNTPKENNKISKKIKDVAKKAAAKIINTDKKVKSVVKKVKEQTVPDIKAEVKKVLKKVVDKKVNKAIVQKFEGFTSDEENDENQDHDGLEQFSEDQEIENGEDYSNSFETFGSIVGFTSEGGIKQEEPLSISNTVIDEILTNQNDKNYIQSNIGVASEAQLNKDVIYAIDYEGIPYLFSNAEVIPYSNWAKQVNNIITQGGVGIKTIIPHYYENNGKFITRIIIVFDDDFYTILQNNTISKVMDFTKDFSISFSNNISKVYTCNESKVLLNQMKQSGIINDSKVSEILNQLNCN